MTQHSKRSPKKTAAPSTRNGGEQVAVAYIHSATVSSFFHHSMLNLTRWDARGPRRLQGHIFEVSGANLSAGRNKLVRQFLDDFTAEWLWMVDTDMVFAVDTLERLLLNASKESAPIVGGLCFGVNDGTLFPTLYTFGPDDAGQPTCLRYHDYPPEAMFQVGATGAACLLIHRSVLQAMQERGFNKTFPWFQETELGDKPCGEDITFCIRANLLGVPVYVDTSVEIGHHKEQLLTADLFRAQRREAAECH